MRDTLYWLPKLTDFTGSLKNLKLKKDETGPAPLKALRDLSQHNLDFSEIGNLDRCVSDWLNSGRNVDHDLPRLRLALLGSSTLDQVLPSIRIAGLRQGVLVDCYLGSYNQYRQDILDEASALYRFKPDVVLLALDFDEALIRVPLGTSGAEVERKIQERLADWERLWKKISEVSRASIIHQTLVIPFQQWFGQMDAQVPSAPTHIAFQMNAALRTKTAENGVHLFDVEALASLVGKNHWQDLPLWFHAKQGIAPLHAPLYGEYVGRLLTAIRGLSKKCIVVDLDNTLWGGVIGEGGLEGIELGQGSALGEAYVAFQMYLKQLKERGIILAVCSKNEMTMAVQPFDQHPDMVLRRDDFSVFIANWEDKASNLKQIAERLNIGLDALVFFDDNPAERGLVRQLLPSVSVPEVPDDPAWYVSCLSDAGYFEAIHFTREDLQRAAQYQANAKRQENLETSNTLDDFLKGLNMRMRVAPFDEVGLARITQLINKSNQFNLTTRRYTEDQIRQLMADSKALTFQVRLEDTYGDNGMISVVIAQPLENEPTHGLLIDTWLMSCRVLGRQVEQALLNQIVEQARQQGFTFLRGEYIPTDKNGIVQDHYARLGFKSRTGPADAGGRTVWDLDLASYQSRPTAIECIIQKGDSLCRPSR